MFAYFSKWLSLIWSTDLIDWVHKTSAKAVSWKMGDFFISQPFSDFLNTSMNNPMMFSGFLFPTVYSVILISINPLPNPPHFSCSLYFNFSLFFNLQSITFCYFLRVKINRWAEAILSKLIRLFYIVHIFSLDHFENILFYFV